ATTDCLEILGATPCGAPTLPLPAAGHAAVDQRWKRVGLTSCYWTDWGQTVCRHPENTESEQNMVSESGGEWARVSDVMITRIRVRCEYKAQNYFVNDALRTRKEIFDGCMQSEIWAAGAH